jgi:hypothetical protein
VAEAKSGEVHRLASEPIATVTVIARREERVNLLARPFTLSSAA